MQVRKLHSWKVSYEEAVAIQKRLVGKLKLTPPRGKIGLVAAADVSYTRGSPILYAAVVVMRLPDFEIVERRSARAEAIFPYIPGLLSFRELPVLCKVFDRLETIPDAVLCDGHGIVHPRGFGLAAHLGLLLERPSVGCAKTPLVGEFREPGQRRWSRSAIRCRGEVVGAVLRTRTGVKPVYVSPGHHIDLEGSVALVRSCTGRYRLPEPAREAHHFVNEARRGAEAPSRSGR